MELVLQRIQGWAHDSADTWAQPDNFLLDESGRPTHVTGVPPDYFAKDGQRWGTFSS